MKKMIELHQLRTFCAVVEKKSFTKAGEISKRVQSTVSAQISLLEKAYGEILLKRQQKGIVPTESGRILYNYAKRIIKLLDESKEKIFELQQIIKGDLVIGASTIPGTYILPRILKNFKKKYPEVDISLSISNSKDVIKKILEGILEIGCVGEKWNDSRLEFKNLAKDKIVLIVPPDHKWSNRASVSLEELKGEPFISREQGSGTRLTVERALKQHDFKKPNMVMEVNSTEAVKESVQAGLGISLVSEWAVTGRFLKKIQIKNVDIRRHFYLVFLKGGIKRRAVEAFVNFDKKMG